MEILVTPSILGADFGHLQDEVDSVSSADWLQLDVMDGQFVPNLSFGAPVARDIKTDLSLDAHLMVMNPENRLEEFFAINVQHITFHAEAVERTVDRLDLIDKIRKGGATAGIAINPDTPVSEIEDVLDAVDMALVMSVNPGFAGQSFIPVVLDKVKVIRESYPELMIQIDGGVSAETAALAREAGANNLVAASAIFGQKDRQKAISDLRGN